MTNFSTITQELWVVELFGLHIRDPEEILPLFDVSYVKKIDFFFRKNSLSPRAHAIFKTLKKNSSVTFAEFSYVYVSKGSLSIGENKIFG